MKLKKIVTNILISAITILILVGCSFKTSNEPIVESPKLEDPLFKEAITTPYGKYPETIEYTIGKVSTNYSSLRGTEYENDDDENNAWTRYAKNKLNVQNRNIFEANSGEDYEQKVSMSIVSGDIPDIMAISDYETLKQLYENDMIEDLSEAYKNCASDKIKEIYSSYGDSFLDKVTFDGKIMALPTTEISHGPGLLWLRKDWMDKLGLEDPKTLDDIENILQQFKDKDPGNNGVGKTEGLLIEPEIVGKAGGPFQVNNIFAHFGAYPKQWIDDGNGEAIYGSTQPEMKQALTLLADWYEKGLIDRQLAVRTADDRKALLVSGKSGAMFNNWWGSWEVTDSVALNPEANWVPYIVPVGDDGKISMYTGNPNSSYIVVRKGFEHPEILFKLASLRFDYALYAEDNEQDMKEIRDYQTYAGGFGLGDILPTNIKAFNDFPNQGKRISEAIESGDTSKLNKEDIAYYEACKKYLEEAQNNQAVDTVGLAHYMSLVKAANLVAQNVENIKEVDPIFFGNTPSMSLKWPTLIKMEEEMYLKIIMGEEPVDYFDKFVEVWSKTGGKEITQEVNKEIAQK